MTLIGRPLARREDPRMVRGQARYLDDLSRPRMCHIVFVRSHHARAKITQIRAPEAAPGVLAVITAHELRGRVRPYPVDVPPGADLADEPHPILAEDEVCYVGQPVAAVVAVSPARAKDAAELVEVEYEPLEPVLEPAASGVELMRSSQTGGDVTGAFARAVHVVRGRYALPRLVAAPIEPRGALAEHDPESGRLTLWCSMQDPHRPLAQLSHILGVDAACLRVIIPDVGGAFGSKGVVPVEAVVATIAARDLGRPVKWVEERTENFLGAYQGRGIEGELELALDGDGHMLALRAELTADLGAYLFTNTAIPPHTASLLLTGCYDIPAASVMVIGRRTNKVPTGPYRGAGRPDAAYMLECLVDDAARRLGVDPIELRRRNLIRSFPHETPLGFSYDSGDYERCLDTALELLGERGADPPPSRLRGTGVALYVERAGGRWESATAALETDGRVSIASSASPHGQGHDVTFAQIAADRLGVGLEQVVLRFGDSDEVPAGVGTFGSRSTAVAGSAVALAVDRLIGQGRVLASRVLGDERAFDFSELARAAQSAGVDLRATARFDSELVFSSGAYAAAVEIDTETGKLTVLRVVAVDDAGTIINPLLADGQVVGGTVQGLGECLTEEAIYDEEGQLRTSTFMDYGLLCAADVPEIVLGTVASPSPRNPLGAKGVGEGGAIGTLPAVANAVADALGGRHLDPPYSPERLWRALAG